MNAIIVSALLGVVMMFSGIFTKNRPTHTAIAVTGLLLLLIANLLNKVNAVTMHGSNTPVKFVQDDFRIRLVNLPKHAPELVTTFALDCDSEPKQSHEGKRAEKPRDVSA